MWIVRLGLSSKSKGESHSWRYCFGSLPQLGWIWSGNLHSSPKLLRKFYFSKWYQRRIHHLTSRGHTAKKWTWCMLKFKEFPQWQIPEVLSNHWFSSPFHLVAEELLSLNQSFSSTPAFGLCSCPPLVLLKDWVIPQGERAYKIPKKQAYFYQEKATTMKRLSQRQRLNCIIIRTKSNRYAKGKRKRRKETELQHQKTGRKGENV